MSNIKITKEELKKLYDNGNSQIIIAKLYNTTPQAICCLMKKYQIAARTHTDVSPIKIKLSDEIIEKIFELYNLGKNRETIAKELNITPWAVRKTIQGKCRGKGESLKLFCKNNTIPLSYIQKQLFFGSLLGDASLIYRKEKDQYVFQVGHCIAQKDYLNYKANILNCNVRSYIKDKNSYSAGKEFFITTYHNKYELEKIYKICFIDGIKSVNKQWLNLIDPLAIAYWFMDDGTSRFSNNCVTASFSTLSFPRDQVILLQKRLLEFNIETTLQAHSDGYKLVIAIRQNSINKFMDLIEPYIVDCMKYKIKRRKI